MPIINGEIRNPERHRYYGLDVHDRVKREIHIGPGKTWIKFGTVIELSGGDNNKVYVLYDDSKEPMDEVAEWLTRIDKNGDPIKNIQHAN